MDNEIKNIAKWNQICDSDKCKYKNCTYTLSRDIVIPNEVFLCRDLNCSMHNQVTLEYLREHHNIARNAFKWWNLNNKPRDGYIYHEMRTSRVRFKYALRFTKTIEDTARTELLAKDLSDGTIDDSWGNVRKMNSRNAIQANSIGGCSGEAGIADYWKNHFSKLLNANSYDATLKTSLMSKFNNVLYCNYMIIPCSLISEAINKLESGKSPGPDDVYAESIKFDHPRLHVVLSICFSLCSHIDSVGDV